MSDSVRLCVISISSVHVVYPKLELIDAEQGGSGSAENKRSPNSGISVTVPSPPHKLRLQISISLPINYMYYGPQLVLRNFLIHGYRFLRADTASNVKLEILQLHNDCNLVAKSPGHCVLSRVEVQFQITLFIYRSWSTLDKGRATPYSSTKLGINTLAA